MILPSFVSPMFSAYCNLANALKEKGQVQVIQLSFLLCVVTIPFEYYYSPLKGLFDILVKAIGFYSSCSQECFLFI